MFGAEADLQWADVSRQNAFFSPLNPRFSGLLDTNLTYRGRADIDAFGTLRGRLGFAWDRLLVYGTGGVIFANVTTGHFLDRTLFAGTPGAIQVTSIGAHDSLVPGWIAGGGIEYAFWNNVSLKIEAMYYELQPTHAGGRDFINNNINAPFCCTHLSTRAEHNGYIVRGGLNWRFWGYDAGAALR